MYDKFKIKMFYSFIFELSLVKKKKMIYFNKIEICKRLNRNTYS